MLVRTIILHPLSQPKDSRSSITALDKVLSINSKGGCKTTQDDDELQVVEDIQAVPPTRLGRRLRCAIPQNSEVSFVKSDGVNQPILCQNWSTR